MNRTDPKIRIGAVSYLNTVPLVWGMLHGPQRDEVELSFSIPSACGAALEEGRIDVGLVPVVEVARQKLEIVPGVGIACHGAVRSILLFSRVPWKQIRTLAADRSSRTSVQLARIILRERFGVEPEMLSREPDLDHMLAEAHAALIIGDPALRIDVENSPVEWLDLGTEWLALTGLPFVFAVWAGKPDLPLERLAAIARGSYDFGKARLAEIVEREYETRGITKDLAEQYLTNHIHYELGTKEQEGMERFLELVKTDSLRHLNSDLIELGMQADQVRKRLHPERMVTYCREPASFTIDFERGEPMQKMLERLDALRNSGAIAVMPTLNEGATAVEYLRILAICRIYLDIPHIQTSWSLGPKICQIALAFGADDITGGKEEQLRRLIRDAGYIPKERDEQFRMYFLD